MNTLNSLFLAKSILVTFYFSKITNLDNFDSEMSNLGFILGGAMVKDCKKRWSNVDETLNNNRNDSAQLLSHFLSFDFRTFSDSDVRISIESERVRNSPNSPNNPIMSPSPIYTLILSTTSKCTLVFCNVVTIAALPSNKLSSTNFNSITY